MSGIEIGVHVYFTLKCDFHLCPHDFDTCLHLKISSPAEVEQTTTKALYGRYGLDLDD